MRALPASIGVLFAVALIVGGAPGCAGSCHNSPVPEVAGPPNVVLVIGCTTRRDQIGAYGGPPGVTPRLDRLAAAGVRFTDAVATSSWTREAAVGLLTGQLATGLGMSDPGPGINRRVLPEAATTLAEHLQATGYRTIGVTANPNLNAIYGMAQGFDAYEGTGTGAFRQDRRIAGDQVVDAALAALDAGPAEPFYLQLTLIDAHLPRRATAQERAPFAAGVPRGVATYRVALHRMDQAVGRLLDGLATRGHEADTVVVFVSDHGEGLHFPKHHGGAHGARMYPSTVALPWIVSGPGVPAGSEVTGLVSGVDVTPTVLGVLGLDGASAGAEGRDWSSRVRGVDETAADRVRAYSLSMFGSADVAALWTPTHQCQRDFGSEDPMVTGCFDRVADPTFRHPQQDAQRLTELAQWREAAVTAGAAFPVVVASEDLQTTRQLEALGYVE